jgi:hypothetical protein
MPQTELDEWGDLAATADHSNRETLQLLDAEGRADGHDPW